MLRRLKEKMNALDSDVNVMKLSPAEKRILITHAIGTIHEKVCNSDAFKRAFHATGTWLPITHLIRDDSSSVNASTNSPTEVEKLVKIQHFSEYKYTEKITLHAVHEAIDKAAAEKAVADAEERRLLAQREAIEDAEKLEMQPYINKASKLLLELEGKLKAYAYVECDVGIIHRNTGLEIFLIGGSCSSAIIAKVFNEWSHCEDLRDYDHLELTSNDIDVYHGSYKDDENAPFVVDFLDIKKYPVDDLFWELNTVKCRSAAGALLAF